MNSATILKHPAFNRPEVANPVFPGKKKGCISLGTARRKAVAAKFFPVEKSINDCPVEQAHPRTACAQLQQFETLFKTADARAAQRMQDFLNAIIEMEINRRVREGGKNGQQ